MQLHKIIDSDHVHFLKSKKKEQALKELIEIAAKKFKLKQAPKILKDVLEREKGSPTGFGKGIAIPHFKFPQVKDIILLAGISRKGIQYQSADGIPVKIIFFIIAPEKKEKEYLELVSKLINFVSRENLIVQNLDFSSKELFLQHLADFDKSKGRIVKAPLLESFLQLEEVTTEIRSLEKEASAQKDAATIQAMIKDLKEKKAKIEGSMERPILDMFNRLDKKYQGSVSSKIFNNACSYCFSNPSTAEIVLLKRGEFVHCPTCGKILYLIM
jgi:mannitol/fructose-specific phosphotransferase system IIA component (Ntr-type)